MSTGLSENIKTNTFRAFRYCGYPEGKDVPADDALLSGALPGYARWKSDTSTNDAVAIFEKQREFWMGRTVLRTYRMEESLSMDNRTVFDGQAEGLKLDFRLVSLDTNREAVAWNMLICSLESFSRMLESTLSQRKWLTPDFLQGLLPPELFADTDTTAMKRMRTYWGMLILASRLIDYRDAHGALPESLKEISNKTPLDAWNHPIIYVKMDQRWLLKSFGENGKDAGFDFDNNVPLFSASAKNPVLFDGMSEARRRLWIDKKLDMPKIQISLHGNGTTVVGRSID
jgi:hypothetical protein